MTTRLADLPEVLSVDQVAEYLGLARNSAYAAVSRGEIRSVKIGRRVLVPRKALEELISPSAQGEAFPSASPAAPLAKQEAK